MMELYMEMSAGIMYIKLLQTMYTQIPRFCTVKKNSKNISVTIKFLQ